MVFPCNIFHPSRHSLAVLAGKKLTSTQFDVYDSVIAVSRADGSFMDCLPPSRLCVRSNIRNAPFLPPDCQLLTT